MQLLCFQFGTAFCGKTWHSSAHLELLLTQQRMEEFVDMNCVRAVVWIEFYERVC